jgi:uncharacterized damage-inducible protein DinB
MKLNELLRDQMEREARATRATLERVPEGRGDWRPHPKSMPLGTLATLVASMSSWPGSIVDSDELDLASAPAPQPAGTNRALVEMHEKTLAASLESLSKTDEEHLMKQWRLRFGDKVLDDRPRHLIIADTICHLAHHRAQLAVYLRLNDQPVPSIYGPSADTAW